MTEESSTICPDCAETVASNASVCMFCGYRFDSDSPTAKPAVGDDPETKLPRMSASGSGDPKVVDDTKAVSTRREPIGTSSDKRALMGPIEAVGSAFGHSFNWKGRASRPAFWWFFLMYLLIVFVAVILDVSLGTYDPEIVVGYISLGIGLIFFFPLISVQVRRLHDTGRSAWWLLLYIPGLIPLVGLLASITLLVLCALRSDEGSNRYGPHPSGAVSFPPDQPG